MRDGCAKVRKRGRPKILRVTWPLTAYVDMGRRERENFRRHIAEILNDTDAAAAANYWRVKQASLALEPYGITLVPNDRVLHVHRECSDRRQISGSVWDGRKLIWRKPIVEIIRTDSASSDSALRSGVRTAVGRVLNS
jgi:hypothetical protein